MGADAGLVVVVFGWVRVCARMWGWKKKGKVVNCMIK